MINWMTLSTAAVVTALTLIAGRAEAAVIISTGTPIAAWDMYGHNTTAGVQTGDVAHTDGLQMNGFVGAWGTMPTNQGSVGNEAVGTSNGYTLRWAIGGLPVNGNWGFTAGSGTALRRDYYYVNNSPRYGGAISWRIEGLTPGASYDMIFYGTLSTTHTDMALAIAGYNSGNPVALDAEGDANFFSVIADSNGYITGTFDDPVVGNGREANLSGIEIAQIAQVGLPEPATLTLLGLGGLMFRRR